MQTIFNATKSHKIENFDTKGAIRIISSNDSIAEINHQNYIKLLSMHPSPSCQNVLPDPPNENSNLP